MIEHLAYPQIIFNPPNPLMGIKERAFIECGCQVWVGMRMDKMETATMFVTCSPAHEDLAHHFNMLLAESTVEPTDDPLVEVCERFLEEAARYALGT